MLYDWVQDEQMMLININMRCIEMNKTEYLANKKAWININMRCIEIPV